jgi:hypothetical protein
MGYYISAAKRTIFILKVYIVYVVSWVAFILKYAILRGEFCLALVNLVVSWNVLCLPVP